ncbi:aminopeptidase Ey-like [Neocloeon triangulifer]|uniref:aminopeptidase Ey-like n=1 Tax=Neocloeon triangulifer TaxID=2078957 RepID=UPI00286ECA7B|nr:aminopeptidase Ey-like [Neocloeon triangulifer]
MTAALILVLLLASFSRGQEASTADSALSTTASSIFAAEDLSTSQAVSSSTEDPVESNISSYRLPENLRPEHYTLDIKTFLEEDNFRFEGRVRIRIFCTSDTAKIVLHSRGLNLTTDEVKVTDNSSGQNLDIAGHEIDGENNFYIIHLKEELKSEHKYKVDIPFEAPLTPLLAGFYRSSYKEKATGKTKWLGVTQFEPTDARRAFPCFDEPAMKAVFQINLIRHKNFSSISNMPLAKTVSLADDWFRDEYTESVRMSTYLVAFVVSDFAYLESTPGDTTFRVWARPDAIAQATYSLDIAPKVLDFFEEYFNVPYPLPKMDMIALPDFASGAMENWGLVTYRETAMLYEEGVSPATSQESVTRVVAHELAHQWFGNLVTMKWWDDIWLNEGFATYVAALGTSHAQPKWSSLEDQMMESLLSVFSVDALQSSHSVSNKIKHASEIPQLFDAISYSKGAILLRMMNHFLGEGTFRRGVTRYLKAHQFGNAAQDALWACLEEQAQLDSAKDVDKKSAAPARATVKEIMDSWTLQTGYPIIQVTRNYEDGTAELTQSRFLTDWYGRTSGDSIWWVPVSYTDSSSALVDVSTMPRLWMNDSSATLKSLPSKEHWLLLNVNSTALYRVNYDMNNWQLLSESLRSKDNYGGIPTLNRAQLVDDALDLARAGQLEYSAALDLLRYLRHEREYLPWRAAFSNLVYFTRMTRRTSGFGAFRTLMQTLLTPIYKELGDEPFRARKPEDTLPQTKNRAQLLSWACSMGVDDCEERASALFQNWQKQTEDPDVVNPVPVDLRSLVYCSAVKVGGQPAWDFIWKRYLSSNVAAEKGKLLGALGCTKEMWLLHKFLDMSLNESSGIRKQDAISVFYSVARSSTGFYAAREFLFSRIKDIHTFFGPKANRIGRYLSAISESMNTEYDLELMKTFTTQNIKYLSDSKLAVKQSLENIQLNVQWRTQHYDSVIEWLSIHANEKYFV